MKAVEKTRVDEDERWEAEFRKGMKGIDETVEDDEELRALKAEIKR